MISAGLATGRSGFFAWGRADLWVAQQSAYDLWRARSEKTLAVERAHAP